MTIGVSTLYLTVSGNLLILLQNSYLTSVLQLQFFLSEQVPTIHHLIERIYTLNEYLIEFIKKNLNNNIGTKFAKELQLGLSRRFPKQGSQNKYRRIANYLAPQYKGLHITDLNK